MFPWHTIPITRKYFAAKLGFDESADEQTINAAMAAGILDESVTVSELCDQLKLDQQNKNLQGCKNMTVSEKDLMGKGGIRVKPESEKYRTEKSLATHPRLGVQLYDEQGHECYTASELEKAKTGVYFKKLASKTRPNDFVMSEHEEKLFQEIAHDDAWSGDWNGAYHKHIAPGLVTKTILNDTTSGGAYVNPIWFNELAITQPLLSGELLPMVLIQDVPRGSAAETPKFGNVTATWNIPSGTAINLFNTDSLITELEHTFFPLTCALEVGDDLLRDSPLTLGGYIVEEMGKTFAYELDRVIAVGNGTSEPEGLTVASGVGSVNSLNGASGPHAIVDYEKLMFGIGKQYRSVNDPFVGYLSNDVSYLRSRQIQNDPQVSTVDQRRVFGMNHENYSTLGRTHRVQNDIANNVVMFGNFKRYRLFRRQGMQLAFAGPGDWQLLRENKQGFLARARYGGGLTLGAAFAKIADTQTT
jgi:hypothetical protein